jgi:predicted RNA methylase
VDIDPNKIEICKNNCSVYQCKDNIEYILSDYLKTGSLLKVKTYLTGLDNQA